MIEVRGQRSNAGIALPGGGPLRARWGPWLSWAGGRDFEGPNSYFGLLKPLTHFNGVLTALLLVVCGRTE